MSVCYTTLPHSYTATFITIEKNCKTGAADQPFRRSIGAPRNWVVPVGIKRWKVFIAGFSTAHKRASSTQSESVVRPPSPTTIYYRGSRSFSLRCNFIGWEVPPPPPSDRLTRANLNVIAFSVIAGRKNGWETISVCMCVCVSTEL